MCITCLGVEAKVDHTILFSLITTIQFYDMKGDEQYDGDYGHAFRLFEGGHGLCVVVLYIMSTMAYSYPFSPS